MNAHRTAPIAAGRLHLVPAPLAREPESPWAARALGELVPPATLEEARANRDDLSRLLRREREAAADFLLALADFDRRRGWERLGHASLFAFLTRELRLSKGAAYLRLSAARLLPSFPEVEAALRSGGLCLSAVGELAKVLTAGNQAEVLPRFLGLSAREAHELVAALAPRADPPVREVLTRLHLAPAAPPPGSDLQPGARPASSSVEPPALDFTPGAVLTSEPLPARPAPAGPPLASAEPLTADLRRLHVTVSKAFLDKVAAARDGLSHARPGATTEQVLDAALDALLERQARRRALVKRPRAAAPVAVPAPTRLRRDTPAA